MVLGMDVKSVGVSDKFPSGYEVYIKGGRKPMGLDAVEWARRAESRIGEICVNSIDADGTKEGYELTVTERISRAVNVPAIASGGADSGAHRGPVPQNIRGCGSRGVDGAFLELYTVAGIKDDMRARRRSLVRH